MSGPVVLLRLDAAQALLEECRDQPTHADVSIGQSTLILSLLALKQLQVQELGVVGERIGRCAWASAGEKESLLSALVNAVANQPLRAKMQNFEHLGSYFTEAQWDSLLDPNRDYAHKLHLMCDHAESLGLRNPCRRPPLFA